jgi:hypothetical protein
MRERAIQMKAAGVAFGDIHRTLGLSRNTVGHWLYGERSRRVKEVDKRCPLCVIPSRPIDDPTAYSYLLGQYLGDGHLLMTQRVPLLSVACDLRYPGLISEIGTAMQACGARTIGHRERTGCIMVTSTWMHWPCLFPQHGPGKKHDRVIELVDWQQELVDDYPDFFLRGLFHSDGCRSDNRIVKGDKTYTYPRYLFVNESADIMGLCQQSLDRLGIPWKMCRRNMLSVARKEAVAALDEHVGPKW